MSWRSRIRWFIEDWILNRCPIHHKRRQLEIIGPRPYGLSSHLVLCEDCMRELYRQDEGLWKRQLAEKAQELKCHYSD